MMYSNPRITTLDASLLPAPPADYSFVNLVSPNSLKGNLNQYPVLLFGPYTYTGQW